MTDTQLIRPNQRENEPWDVSVVNVAPPKVEREVLRSSSSGGDASGDDASGGASGDTSGGGGTSTSTSTIHTTDDTHPRPAAAAAVVVGATTPDGHYVGVYRDDTIRIWSNANNNSSSSSKTTSGTMHLHGPAGGPLQPPKTVHKCFHPSLLLQQQQPSATTTTTTTTTRPLLLALSNSSSSTCTSSSSSSFLHVLAAHPRTGLVLFWKLDMTAPPSLLPKSMDAKLVVPLQRALHKDNNHNTDTTTTTTTTTTTAECITALSYHTCHHYGVFLLGTSHNRVFQCHHTTLPCMLYANELTRTTSTSTSTSSATSWMGRWWSGDASAGANATTRSHHRQHDDDQHHVVALLGVEQNNNNNMTFVSVTRSGDVELWQGTTTTTHAATTQSLLDTALTPKRRRRGPRFVETPLVSFRRVLLSSEQQQHNTSHNPETATTAGTNPSSSSVQVLQCAVDTHSHSTSTTTTVTATLDCIVRYNDTYIYWIQGDITLGDTAASLSSCYTPTCVTWLNRFHGDVSCVGLVVCPCPSSTPLHSSSSSSSTMTHAVFQYDRFKGPVTCVAKRRNGTAAAALLYEVDYPTTHVPQFVPGTVTRDLVTNGWWGLARSGLGIRTRCHVVLEQPQEPNNRSETSESDALLVQTLTRHLQSAFWHSYQRAEEVRLPPSLQAAEVGPLERAVLVVAKVLQVHPNHANLLECHLEFVTLLQQGGIYRSLSYVARWTLLGIGQELAVRRAIRHHNSVVASVPTTKGVAETLWESHTRGDAASMQRLCVSLTTADSFRREYARSKYDIVDPSSPPSGLRVLVTTHASLQKLLGRILWDEAEALLEEQTKLIVRVALQSHRETRGESSASADTYNDVKQVGIPLIRRIPDDVLAFQLSVDHAWFEGICQMSLDHRKEVGFDLEPLFATFRDDSSFASYVLDWFTEKGMYADVLNFGRLAPEILMSRCETDSRLIRCRWIAAVRSGEYDRAGDWLVNATLDGPLNVSLADTKRSLSLAKLTLPRNGRKLVSAKLELVRAQEMLLGEYESPLLRHEKLLRLAVNKLDESRDKNESVQYAMIGLAIAKAIEDSESRIQAAARVWSKCLSLDIGRWMQWLEGEDNYVDDELKSIIIDSTLFGALWNEVSVNPDEVTYGNSLEYEVVDQLGLNPIENVELKRLLNAVTASEN